MPRVVDLDERRAALAAAAARVIARSGISAASMRQIAAEAGWTTGALTHYFADKRDLLRFTLEASLAGRRARRDVRATMAPEEALRDTLARALPLDDEARLHWTVTVAFCAEAAGDPELATVQRDAYREFRDAVADLVVECGRASADGARTAAEHLIAVVDGIAVQALFDPESWPAARQLEAVEASLAG